MGSGMFLNKLATDYHTAAAACERMSIRITSSRKYLGCVEQTCTQTVLSSGTSHFSHSSLAYKAREGETTSVK